MKLFPLTTWRLLIAAVGLVLVIIVSVWAHEWYWSTHPEAVFRSVTGRELPAGVHVVAYANRMDDALFHTSHYWMLEGSPEALSQVIAGRNFLTLDLAADGRDYLPRFFSVLGVKDAGQKASAVWINDSERGSDPRDHQFCIMEGGTGAFYRH